MRLLGSVVLVLVSSTSLAAKVFDRTAEIAAMTVHYNVALPKDYDAGKTYPAVLSSHRREKRGARDEHVDGRGLRAVIQANRRSSSGLRRAGGWALVRPPTLLPRATTYLRNPAQTSAVQWLLCAV